MTRPVIFNINGATTQDTALYAREELTPGLSFEGPAIVTQYDTTTVLPPGWQARIDGMGNIIAEYAERVKERHEHGKSYQPGRVQNCADRYSRRDVSGLNSP